MSETWTSLLAALVGAIVGGAASLAGTMLVNRMQMATNARMRLYDELLPKLAGPVDNVKGTYDPLKGKYNLTAFQPVEEVLEAVRRACAIAGRKERQAAHNLMVLWLLISNPAREDFPTNPMLLLAEIEHELHAYVETDRYPMIGKYVIPKDTPGMRSQTAHRLMQHQIQALSDHLAAKLG